MEHSNNLCDYLQARWSHFEPLVEGSDQLSTHVFARVRKEVVERAIEDLFFLLGPTVVVMK